MGIGVRVGYKIKPHSIKNLEIIFLSFSPRSLKIIQNLPHLEWNLMRPKFMKILVIPKLCYSVLF